MATALLVSAGAAFGQTAVGMAYGGYFPLGGSLIREIGGLNGSPVPYPVFEKWQTGAVVLSGRLTDQLTPRLAVELKYAYIPGRVDTRDSTNAVLERSAHLSLLSVRAPIKLTDPNSGTVVRAGVGIALASRGGRAWGGYGGRTDPAAVFAISFGGLLGRRSKWSSRLELEDYISAVQYTFGTYQPTTRRLHHDVMLTVGVDYSFKRPRRIPRTR